MWRWDSGLVGWWAGELVGGAAGWSCGSGVAVVEGGGGGGVGAGAAGYGGKRIVVRNIKKPNK